MTTRGAGGATDRCTGTFGLLERVAGEVPDRLALVEPFVRGLTFAEWLHDSVALAARLSEAGITSGMRVGLLFDRRNWIDLCVAYFAVQRLGAVTVTVSAGAPASVRDFITQDAGISAWIAADPSPVGNGPGGDPYQVLPVEPPRCGDRVPPPATTRPEQTADILYTSGTTGLPKGVLNSHAAYEAAGAEIVSALGFTPEDRCMVVLPLFHANPQMYAVMSALHVGYALVLREKFSASSFFADARRFRATCFTYVGTILSILAARHERDLDHALRFCTGGGAPEKVWREVEQRFGVKVRELYGMTEIGGFVSINTEGATRIGSCGRLRPDMDVRIVDAEDGELPAGAQGEIVVRPLKPGVILSGYWRQPDKMVEACRNLWFHTGDRGHIDADGYLHFHGRIKELIRRGGEMVSPVEVETVLRKMPGVADCAVVGVDDAVLGQEIKVLVVPDAAALAPADVLAFLDGRVPSFMIPRYVEFAASVPKTETEKVQRHKIAYVDARVHDMASAERRIQPRHGGVVSGTAGEG